MTLRIRSRLVRIAAVLAFIYGLGHLSGIPWTPATGPAESSVLELMQSVRFEAEGASRTYWNFYVGFGLIVGAFLIISAVALWQVGSLVAADQSAARPLTITMLMAFVANGALAWYFFFAVPAAFALAIAVVLAASVAPRSVASSRRSGTAALG